MAKFSVFFKAPGVSTDALTRHGGYNYLSLNFFKRASKINLSKGLVKQQWILSEGNDSDN